jgi:hypothetical protein
MVMVVSGPLFAVALAPPASHRSCRPVGGRPDTGGAPGGGSTGSSGTALGGLADGRATGTQGAPGGGSTGSSGAIAGGEAVIAGLSERRPWAWPRREVIGLLCIGGGILLARRLNLTDSVSAME